MPSSAFSSAEQLCDILKNAGWPVTYISSSLDQKERFKAFHRLRAFQCRILVSTDLTSRGIDAENVNLVVSLEVPWKRDVYLHRIGRAGRYGSYGASIILVSDASDEMVNLSRIEDPNSTPICQLPDPIPTDLATSECKVDVNKLVTVTKLTTMKPKLLKPERIEFTEEDEIEKEDPAPPLIQQHKRLRPDLYRDQTGSDLTEPENLEFAQEESETEEEKETVHLPIQQQQRYQARSDPQQQRQTVKEHEGLATDLVTTLSEYTRMMLAKPSVRLEMTVNGEGGSEEIEEGLPFHDNDLEKKTLCMVANFLDGFEEHPNAVVKAVLDPEFQVKAEEEWEHCEDQVPRKVEKEEKHARLPDRKYMNKHRLQCNTEEVSFKEEIGKLTPRQEAIWNEYCRLIGWKDYFYQAWWLAASEYEAALAEFKQASGAVTDD